jgi:hypothetical protein
MDATKTPVLLVVMVQTSRLRWFVATLGLDGTATPLVCSATGNLEKYRGLDFMEQVSFLRHRFCGVLQCGCDRLWGRGQKACQFVIAFDEPLPEPTGRLTESVADHFVQWMLNPPVVVYAGPQKVAGTIDSAREQLLRSHLGALLDARDDPAVWELAPTKAAV